MRMHILLDGRVFEQEMTGIGKVTLGLYRACCAIMPELRVSVIHRAPLASRLPFPSKQVGEFSSERLWRHGVLPLQAWKEKPAVVHFPWNGGVPFLRTGGLVVCTLHDVLPLEIPDYFATEEERHRYHSRRQKDINRSDLLVTDSEYSRSQLETHFRLHARPAVISPGPTLPVVRTGRNEDSARQGDYFLYVGGYDPRKGLETLVEVFLDLWQRRVVEARLVLVGARRNLSGSFTENMARGRELGAIEERGYVDDEQLAALYAHARALIYPSRYEGFGLPPLEAMSLGCPVVTTRCTALPEVCGEAALYLEGNDPASLAAAVTEIDRNDLLRSDLRAKGQRQAARFSWERSAQAFLDLLLARLGQR